MAYWLAERLDGQEQDWIQRFDPRFWTVNFPRPMMAALTTPERDSLRVDLAFLTQGDLAGVIWESEDSLDHPLLAYATNRDYARTTLSFHWRSAGVVALDGVNGPTLTIEGRDASGAAHVWYVRLWNFAQGSGQDAQITLPFSQIYGGWSAGEGADPLYPSAIDRMFISLVPQGFVAGSTAPLATPLDGWVELSGIRCQGQHAMLPIGQVHVPPHGLAAASAYDDGFNQTPARQIRQMRQLGYRGSVLHYVGMSHFFRLVAGDDGFVAATSGDLLCAPARAWHAEFFAMCKAAGYAPIASLSFELFAQHCPQDWSQRAWDGTRALTGWSPPSSLLSPAHPQARAWLQDVAAAFAQMLLEAGCALRFQIGEPWWWVLPDGRICLYDAASRAALGGNPVEIPSLRVPLDAAQKALLDAAGALLASATGAVAARVRQVAAAAGQAAEVMLLTFAPTVLDPATPEARRANMPVGWAKPAFDRLQVEDYDWLTAGDAAQRQAAYATINARLGYAPQDQDYLAGFVLNPDQSAQWRLIDAGIDEAQARQAHEIFVWALPQINRDGYVRCPKPWEGEDMQAFDDVPFPLALGLDASIAPQFSTSVVTTASGHERRNSLWADAKLSFDLGTGVRSEAELGVLLAFFRARRGAARGFRVTDPMDHSSHGMSGTPSAIDQPLGTGDGVTTSFALIKAYGEAELGLAEAQIRRITRPQAGSVLVSVNGVAVETGWQALAGGIISFSQPPAAGAVLRCGYRFDVPVRFQSDQLDLSGLTFAAGEVPSVMVVEIKEAV